MVFASFQKPNKLFSANRNGKFSRVVIRDNVGIAVSATVDTKMAVVAADIVLSIERDFLVYVHRIDENYSVCPIV